MKRRQILLCCVIGLTACSEGIDTAPEPEKGPRFVDVGSLENPRIDEASGLQAGVGDVFYLHNDERRDVFVIDRSGRNLGSFKLDGAKNRDWEDMTRVPNGDGHWLVIADTGDNAARYEQGRLYFFEEPDDGSYGQDRKPVHVLEVHYEDGPHDIEAVAYDPHGESILFLTKRDHPPRLYGIPLADALRADRADAHYLGEVPGFRPPDRMDFLRNPRRGAWVSQPTGMDISPDGRTAAVITYRSLYLFHRTDGQSWPEAFQNPPLEIYGPPGTHDEAVSFSLDGRSVYVTTERRPAPLHRLDLE
jgi:hypothetical protein